LLRNRQLTNDRRHGAVPAVRPLKPRTAAPHRPRRLSPGQCSG
jgi:hypothetical protein